MTVRGRVKNGVVVLDDPNSLPEGAEVSISLLQEHRTWADVFKDLFGTAEGLPSDLAENHDHYIHGAPKR